MVLSRNRQQHGGVLGEPALPPGLPLLHRAEHSRIHAVGNDPHALGREAQGDGNIPEGLAHRRHPVRAPQGPAELGSVEAIARETHDAATKSDDDRASEDAAEERGRQAVRVSEVRVDDLEGEAPTEARDESNEGEKVQYPVEALAVARQREEPRVVYAQPLLVIDAGDKIALRAQPPVQGEPGQGRDHDDLAALGQAADPMLHEDATRGLLRVGEGGAQHEHPHHATPP